MVEAVVLWNEPNNLSHWNFHLDPGWKRFAEMVRMGSSAIRAVNPGLPIVLEQAPLALEELEAEPKEFACVS